MRLCDRRNRVQHVSLVFLFVVIVVASAYAADKATGTESLAEHSTAIIGAETYIILALAAALVGVAIWNFKDIKNTIRENHNELKGELKRKVSIQVHNAICDHKIEIDE